MSDTTTKFHSILTVDDLAKRLRVHRVTIYKLVRMGQIPGAFRIGTDLRFSAEQIDGWEKSITLGESSTDLKVGAVSAPDQPDPTQAKQRRREETIRPGRGKAY